MNPERAAEQARRDLGIGLESPVPDLLRLLEDEEGLRVFIVELPEGGVDGAYQVDGGTPFVLINQRHGPERKRFTLAHEYGHHRLEHGAQLDESISLGARSQVEVEANQFAAAFLMPRAGVDAWFARHEDRGVDVETVVRLAFFFNVSNWVTVYRLQAVGRVSSQLKGRITKQLKEEHHYELAARLGLNRAEDTIRVEGRLGGHVPAVMQRRVADLVRRDLLSEEAAAARLRVAGSEAESLLSELMAGDGDSD